MVLLVLQDKAIFNAFQPEPQVIAEAIAAYQNKNNTAAQITSSP
jgi:hypothetical protein